MKVNVKLFFNKNWIEDTQINRTRYINGWSLTEIKENHEFLLNWFEKDKKFFFKWF
jgi:hypothetical protein